MGRCRTVPIDVGDDLDCKPWQPVTQHRDLAVVLTDNGRGTSVNCLQQGVPAQRDCAAMRQYVRN